MEDDGGSMVVVHGGLMAVHGYVKQVQYPLMDNSRIKIILCSN